MRYKVIITHTVLLSLADNPFQPGIKKLQGLDNTFRARAGNYRILYRVNQGELMVTVIRIGDRKDVYQ